MKKLRLELDALVVESFDTADAEGGAGTVHGNALVELGQAQAAKTDVRVDCGSWIDACPSRLGTCDFTCSGQRTCDLCAA